MSERMPHPVDENPSDRFRRLISEAEEAAENLPEDLPLDQDDSRISEPIPDGWEENDSEDSSAEDHGAASLETYPEIEDPEQETLQDTLVDTQPSAAIALPDDRSLDDTRPSSQGED